MNTGWRDTLDSRVRTDEYVEDCCATEEQIVAVEEALVELDLDKAERIKAAKEEHAPAPSSSVEEGERLAGGVSLVGSQTSGAQSLWSTARSTGVPDGDGQ